MIFSALGGLDAVPFDSSAVEASVASAAAAVALLTSISSLSIGSWFSSDSV